MMVYTIITISSAHCLRSLIGEHALQEPRVLRLESTRTIPARCLLHLRPHVAMVLSKDPRSAMVERAARIASALVTTFQTHLAPPVVSWLRVERGYVGITASMLVNNAMVGWAATPIAIV